MKFRTAAGIIILIILLAVSAWFISTLTGISIKLPFTDKQKTVSTETILKEIRNISSLSTVEYIYKTVFPFDFLDEDTQWEVLLNKQRNGIFLTENEKDSLEIFRLCQNIGINLRYETFDFVVISSVVKAGFNLENNLSIHDIDREGRNISIRIPEVEITEFTIEDSDSTSYLYPDLNVSPKNWKEITDFVEAKTRLIVIEDGILKNAEERGREFIRALMLESGWDSVSFIR